MKTLLITIITGIIGLTALPTTADAAPKKNLKQAQSSTFRSGHSSCGCATFTKKVLTGYDARHNPICRYSKVPTSHKCRKHTKASRHHASNNNQSRGYSTQLSFNTKYGNVSIAR